MADIVTGDPRDPEPNKKAEEYIAVAETFGDEFRKVASDRIHIQVDNYLMRFGDPEMYVHLVNFADSIVEASVLWLITHGFLKLTKKARLPAEEVEKRRKEAEEKKGDDKGGSKPATVSFGPAGYL